jgi:hypothetical protein
LTVVVSLQNISVPRVACAGATIFEVVRGRVHGLSDTLYSGFALEMLVRALQAQVEPAERSIVETSSFHDLELAAKQS